MTRFASESERTVPADSGPISPGELSGGVQTLICIYKCPELIFDATSCGNNCARWLLEIGKEEDVMVMLEK